MPRALVTGAHGFLGRHLMAGLARGGWTAIPLRFRFDGDGPLPRLLAGGTEHPPAALGTIVGEASPDAVFHLAGTRGPALLAEVNTGLAGRLIDAMSRSAPAARLVLIGSAAEYGDVPGDRQPVGEDEPCRPVSAYGASKLAQTLAGLAAAERGLDVVVARCFNLVGPGMPAGTPLADIAARLRAPGFAGRLATGDLDVERDFIDVAGAAGCLAGLATANVGAGTVVNLCSGAGQTLRAGVEALLAGVAPRPLLVPDPALAAGPRIARMVGDPGRLNRLGLAAPPADFAALARLLRAPPPTTAA